MMVRTAERDRPFREAVIVALTDEETEVVLTVKPALIAPAGMVTLDGTVTLGEPELIRLTVVGDDTAALIVTVPCDGLPPATLAGFKVSEESAGPAGGGRTVNDALSVESPK
jgi:hypothetical protein